MDDFVISNLNESRNEWCARLVSILTPLVIQGIRSIFNEAWSLCVSNGEVNKYLMTFQNMLCSVHKWNSNIIEEERKRIIEKSGCNYLEDLITCVHIIQLKILTSIRVGTRQKKIDITIPKLDNFIHKVYINVARKVYTNVYLFEKNINPLQLQKNNRELEMIVQECILITIRDSIPTESIIRAYLDQSVEQEEEVIIENIEQPVMQPTTGDNNATAGATATATTTDDNHPREVENTLKPPSIEEYVPEALPSIKNINDEPIMTRLSFNDMDSFMDDNNQIEQIHAPKTIEQLEKISMERAMQRKMEEEEDRIHIHTEPIDLSGFDILDDDNNHNHNNETGRLSDPLIDFEEL
jgi:hypothetical protein